MTVLSRPSPRVSRRALLRGAAALGTMPLLPRLAAGGPAETWPSRPVKFVVPFAAGGTTDILARLVAGQMAQTFRQDFVVENKAGAGGNLAAGYVAAAEPDGYTFIVGTPGIHAINQFVYKAMSYDPIADIAPVVLIAKVPNLLAVTNTLPVRSVAELIAYAKSRPGELVYGTSGLGSTGHLSMELLKSTTGIKIAHVPYKGSAPMLAELIAGRVQLTMDNLPSAKPHVDAGAIRPLAVSTAQRWPLLPALPTIAEAGVPGYDAASWFTLGAPAKTPPEIIAKLGDAVDRFVRSENGTVQLHQVGADPAGGSPEDMRRFVLAEMDKWGNVARTADIDPM